MELSALPAARCPLDLSTGGRTVVCRGCRGCNCATRPQLVACTCRRRTDGRAEFGWCSALCRWSSEDSRGFARDWQGKEQDALWFRGGGTSADASGSTQQVAGFLLRTCRLPPPRTCHGHAAPPERYLTAHLGGGGSEREEHSGIDSVADCSFTTSPSSMVLEASMLLEHVPQPTHPTHCT